MIASDHDGRSYLALFDEPVESRAHFRPLAVFQPTDARWQTLECVPLLRLPNPARESRVFGKRLQHGTICLGDVSGVTRECDPPEWAGPTTEQRANERRNEAWYIECFEHATSVRYLATEVIAIIEDNTSFGLELEHRSDVSRHRIKNAALVLGGGSIPGLIGRVESHARRDVPDPKVMGRGLIRDEIRHHTSPNQFRQHFSDIADQANRERATPAPCVFQETECSVELSLQPVAVPAVNPPADSLLVHIYSKERCAVHRSCQGLGPTHSAKSAGDHQSPLQRTPKVLSCALGERFVGALEYPLSTDVNPRPCCHLPVHRQAESVQAAELVPRGPARDDIRIRD